MLLVVACGKETVESPGNAAAYQTGSNHCSFTLVTDHATLALPLPPPPFVAPDETDRLNSLKLRLDDFQRKYDGVKCLAEVNGTLRIYDVNLEMQQLNAKIAQRRETTPNAAFPLTAIATLRVHLTSGAGSGTAEPFSFRNQRLPE